MDTKRKLSDLVKAKTDMFVIKDEASPRSQPEALVRMWRTVGSF